MGPRLQEMKSAHGDVEVYYINGSSGDVKPVDGGYVSVVTQEDHDHSGYLESEPLGSTVIYLTD